jgi:hypothetical protein
MRWLCDFAPSEYATNHVGTAVCELLWKLCRGHARAEPNRRRNVRDANYSFNAARLLRCFHQTVFGGFAPQSRRNQVFKQPSDRSMQLDLNLIRPAFFSV